MFGRTLAVAILSCGTMGCAMASDESGTSGESGGSGGSGESGESWYAVHQEKELTAEEPVETGPGCVLAVYSYGSSGTASSSTGVPWESHDFVLDMQTEGKGLEVKVSSQGELLEERDYDTAFLRSGEVDGFQVTTLDERVFQLVFWGAQEGPVGG